MRDGCNGPQLSVTTLFYLLMCVLLMGLYLWIMNSVRLKDDLRMEVRRYFMGALRMRLNCRGRRYFMGALRMRLNCRGLRFFMGALSMGRLRRIRVLR